MTQLLNHITTINHIHYNFSAADELNVFTAITSYIYTFLLRERDLLERYEDHGVSPLNTKYTQRNNDDEKYDKQSKHLTYFAK